MTAPAWVCPHGREKSFACRFCCGLGENSAQAKLTDVGALEVVEMNRQGFSKAAIGRQFGVTARAIACVLAGVTWWQVTGIPRRSR